MSPKYAMKITSKFCGKIVIQKCGFGKILYIMYKYIIN